MRFLPIIVLVLSIVVLGIHIGITAKNGTNEHAYLLPIGITLLVLGLLLLVRNIRAQDPSA